MEKGEEVSRAVPRFPQYHVTNLGRVYSWRSMKWLRPGISSNGYPTVALGRGNTRTLHSLVAEAFLGKCPEGKEVRHKDGDRTNPKLSNLEYGTRGDNIKDAVAHGTWDGSGRIANAQQYITPEHRAKAWETRRARYGVRGCR